MFYEADNQQLSTFFIILTDSIGINNLFAEYYVLSVRLGLLLQVLTPLPLPLLMRDRV